MGNIVSRYICRDCGSVFDYPATVWERHDWLDDKPMIPSCSVCPDCGSGNYTEALVCEYCQEEYSADDMVADLFCKICFEHIIKSRTDILRAFAEENRDVFAEFAEEYLRNSEKQ